MIDDLVQVGSGRFRALLGALLVGLVRVLLEGAVVMWPSASTRTTTSPSTLKELKQLFHDAQADPNLKQSARRARALNSLKIKLAKGVAGKFKYE